MRSRIIDKDQAGTRGPLGLSGRRRVGRGRAARRAEGRRASAHGGPARRSPEAGSRRGAPARLRRRVSRPARPSSRSRTLRLAALADAFAHPFQNLERAVEDEIVNLAVELASHLVRHEIQHDPELLHGAIADCLGVLASSVRDVTLYLHPDDAALVRGELQARRKHASRSPRTRRCSAAICASRARARSWTAASRRAARRSSRPRARAPAPNPMP